jgi:hypothetical protein
MRKEKKADCEFCSRLSVDCNIDSNKIGEKIREKR